MRAVSDPRLIETIRASVIGEDEAIATPFGLRRVTYADYTASGRSLSFIEDVIRDAVLPLYANTHTESSGTGLQTTRFREDARAIIGEAVHADPDEHVVLFCGSGSTGALHTLIDCLELRIPAGLDDRFDLRSRTLRPSGRSCSSARTSTIRTNCHGASRSPTSSRFPKTTTGGSTSTHCRRRWNATPTGR